MKITLELARVSACEVGDCGYNAKGACHAKAITIGDMFTPGCDTFMNSDRHCSNTRIVAGVGACKVAGCRHNKDFECSAESIQVGRAGDEIRCLSYQAR